MIQRCKKCKGVIGYGNDDIKKGFDEGECKMSVKFVNDICSDCYNKEGEIKKDLITSDMLEKVLIFLSGIFVGMIIMGLSGR